MVFQIFFGGAVHPSLAPYLVRLCPEIVTHANNDLNSISDWLKANKLSLKVTGKTEYMFIGSDQNIDKLRDVPLYCFLKTKL